MLRREPTKITLTMDDIVGYDERRKQRDQAKQEENFATAQARQAAMEEDPFGSNASMSGFGQKPERQTRTRDQRIGVGSSRN